MLDYSTPLSIAPGEVALMELPFSEVNMCMGVAGREMRVRLLVGETRDGHLTYAAQLLREDGSNYSAPITIGEAGIFQTGSYEFGYHFHYYPPASEVIASR